MWVIHSFHLPQEPCLSILYFVGKLYVVRINHITITLIDSYYNLLKKVSIHSINVGSLELSLSLNGNHIKTVLKRTLISFIAICCIVENFQFLEFCQNHNEVYSIITGFADDIAWLVVIIQLVEVIIVANEVMAIIQRWLTSVGLNIGKPEEKVNYKLQAYRKHYCDYQFWNTLLYDLTHIYESETTFESQALRQLKLRQQELCQTLVGQKRVGAECRRMLWIKHFFMPFDLAHSLGKLIHSVCNLSCVWLTARFPYALSLA